MTEVQLVDVSLRDGNQSLWGATGLRTEHIVQIAPVLNRVGFRALDFMSSTAMGVAVRTHREDPWERIRLTRAAMPDTPLQLIGTGFRFISWERAHPEVMQLVYERLVAAGISRFVLLDPMHDMDAVRRSVSQLESEYALGSTRKPYFVLDLAARTLRCRLMGMTLREIPVAAVGTSGLEPVKSKVRVSPFLIMVRTTL